MTGAQAAVANERVPRRDERHGRARGFGQRPRDGLAGHGGRPDDGAVADAVGTEGHHLVARGEPLHARTDPGDPARAFGAQDGDGCGHRAQRLQDVEKVEARKRHVELYFAFSRRPILMPDETQVVERARGRRFQSPREAVQRFR